MGLGLVSLRFLGAEYFLVQLLHSLDEKNEQGGEVGVHEFEQLVEMRYPLFAKHLLSHAEYAKLLVGKGFDFVLGKFGAVAA